MFLNRTDVDDSYLLPKTLAATIDQVVRSRNPTFDQVVFRALFFYLQERLDQFADEGYPHPHPAHSDSRDGNDGNSKSLARGDSRDGDDGNSKSLARGDSRDGNDGKSESLAADDDRDGDDDDFILNVGLRPDGGFEFSPVDAAPTEAEAAEALDDDDFAPIDDALLYRIYNQRFDFTASDLRAIVAVDYEFIGRADLIDTLTPSSIARALKRLGLPFHRTGQRRRYSITFPFMVTLLERRARPWLAFRRLDYPGAAQEI